MRHAIPTVLACLMIGGCGRQPARIDATNEQTLRTSLDAITSPMTEEQKKEFSADSMTLTMPTTMSTLLRKSFDKTATKQSVNMVDIFKPLHGMTAEEVHARATAVRESLKRPRAG